MKACYLALGQVCKFVLRCKKVFVRIVPWEYSYLRSSDSSCVSLITSDALTDSKSLNDKSKWRIDDGNAGGVDRKPRCEQLADMSTSIQMQTRGGHTNNGFLDGAMLTPFVSLFDESLLASEHWKMLDSRRKMKKGLGKVPKGPGLTQFMLWQFKTYRHKWYLRLIVDINFGVKSV